MTIPETDAGVLEMNTGANQQVLTAPGRAAVLAVRTLLLAFVAVAFLLPQHAAAQPPRVIKSLEDLTLRIDNGPRTVDLRGVYWGELEDCDAVSSDESVATVEVVNGYDLVVTPVGVGTATITATASNEYGSVEHDFEVTIIHVPPEAVGAFPDYEMRVGDVLPLELAGAFQGDALEYTASSSDDGAASVSVVGSTASITAHKKGMATITFTATNTGGSAEQKVTLWIMDALPEAVGRLPDLTITIGDDPVSVNFADAFTGSALQFAASSSAVEFASVTLGGENVTVTAIAAGATAVTITATNSEGMAEQTFNVTVKDQPPEAVGTLHDLTITLGDDPVSVNFAEAFTGSALQFAASSSAEEFASVSLGGENVTVTAIAAGVTAVTITATNSEGMAEQTFNVTVKDQPPEAVGTLHDLTITIGDDPVSVNFAEAFTGSALQFAASSSAEEFASVSLGGENVTVTAIAAGVTAVTITATNSEGMAKQTFNVTVKDQPPEAVGTLPDLTLTVGDDPVEVALASAFRGTGLRFAASSSADQFAGVSVDGSTATVTPIAAGPATVTVTATNNAGTAEQTFTVTVKDQLPEAVGTLSDLTLTVGDDPVSIDVAEAFSGSALEFAASSSADSLAGVTVEGSMATVSAIAAGTSTVTVTASNSAGSAEQTFTVTVKDSLPMAVGKLEDLTVTVGDDPVSINFAEAFSGSALQFSASSSATDLAGVSLDGHMVMVNAIAAGMATVTITASNTAGAAEQTINVTVKDQPPMAVGQLPDLTIRIGDDPATVDLAPAFTGTALVFSAMSSAEGMAAVAITGATLDVTAVAAGTAMVTVMATNSEGSAEHSFAVTVEDVPPEIASRLPDLNLITGGEPALVDAVPAFSGTALVFSASASGEAASIAVAGGQVTVSPLVEGDSTITVTATNSAGTASQTFTATVSTDAAEADAIENTLAALARSTLASVTSAIGGRFRAERMGTAAAGSAAASSSAFDSAGMNPLGQWSQPGVGAANGFFSGGSLHDSNCCIGSVGGWIGAERFGYGPGMNSGGLQRLHGMSFAVPLNAAGSGSGTGWTPAAEWTFWGSVDRQGFDGSGYDGDLTSIYFGADARFGDNWLAGVAVSHSSGDADYDFSSSRASGSGDIDTDMVSVLPYVHWTFSDMAEVWAIAGAGWGDIDHKRTATTQEGEADLSMWMLAAGGRRTLASGAEWNFALMGDAGMLEMQTDGGVGIIDDMNVSVGRVKVGFEGERIISMDGGDMFSIFGQIGGRHDSGDGDTGSGVELAGGVRWDTAGRIRLEAKARLLSLHSADSYEENGVSLSAIVRPRSDGGGMSLALSSYLGTGMSGNNTTLEQGYGYPGRIEEFSDYYGEAWGMDAKLGYTLRVDRLSGLLTPFASFDMAGNDGHGMRMGLRYDLANRVSDTMLNLEFTGGQQYDRYRRETDNMVQLRGELRF